jgi:hypothetical protein
VTEYVVQEIDLATRRVLFEWHSLDHVPVARSYRRPPRRPTTAYDYFHGNSIEPPPPGGSTVMVSSRNTSAVYGIDRRTGRVKWILGGKRDEFGLVAGHPGWQFCAQHDARRLPNGDITLFDNGATNPLKSIGCPNHAARALQFEVDLEQRSARLVRSVSSLSVSSDGRGYFPIAVGSARPQPDGNLLVSWGGTGRVTEHTPDGTVNLDLTMGRLHSGNWTYRAVRGEWRGWPGGRPRIEARAGVDGGVRVWASWNGATEIATWRVLAGGTRHTLQPAGDFGFTGLETEMTLSTAARYVAVQALDAGGDVLGQSATARTAA